MKQQLYLLILLLILPYKNVMSQVSILDETPSHGNYWIVALHAGYDFPSVKNGLKYIDYDGNFIGGGGISYYWSWYGLGADFDYTVTSAKSSYPAGNNYILDSNIQMSGYSLSESKINRLFLGVGPDFKLDLISRTILVEFNLRAGVSSFKGGRVELRETTTENNQILLFHAGYNNRSAFTTKGRFGITWFPKEKNFGISAGVYFLKLYNVTESVDAYSGKSAILQTFKTDINTNTSTKDGPILYRSEACNCEASSYGGFISLKLRIPPRSYNQTNQY